ncbi:MAG: putative integral rane protein [Thermoleophilia bacterium]|nr:putative integral rane protein [Thermoleophilia bacterium]
MSLFEILLIVHLLAAMIWIGGALVGMLIGIFLSKGDDANAMAKFCTAFATIAGPAFGGSSLIVVATGIWMVAESSIEFSALWVSLSFAGWLVSMLMGATIVGMTWAKVGKVLREGATLDGTRPLISRAVRLTWLDLAMRVAVVVLMVTRPV